MLCWFSTLLRSLPSASRALQILVPNSLSREPSQEMVLPRYLKCSTLVNVVSSMTMVGAGGGGVGVWCRLVEYLGLVETDCQAEEVGGI